MMVILRENVENLGIVGDVVRVSDGYGRNFLIPQNLALLADKANVEVLEHHKRLLEKKRLAQKQAKKELAVKISGCSVKIARKVAEENRLFGSVNAVQIWEAIKAAGFDIQKQSVVLEHPIKALGTYSIMIRFDTEVTASINLEIVKE